MSNTSPPTPTGDPSDRLGEVRASLAADAARGGLAGMMAAAILRLFEVLAAILADFRAGRLAIVPVAACEPVAAGRRDEAENQGVQRIAASAGAGGTWWWATRLWWRRAAPCGWDAGPVGMGGREAARAPVLPRDGVAGERGAGRSTPCPRYAVEERTAPVLRPAPAFSHVRKRKSSPRPALQIARGVRLLPPTPTGPLRGAIPRKRGRKAVCCDIVLKRG